MRSRDAIIEATLGLIETDGYSAVNVAAVAAKAGVSRQTVYSIFGGREEMVSQAVTSVALRSMQGILVQLDTITSTCAYIVELSVLTRRELRSQPVLKALLRPDQGNPLFDDDMMGRTRPVVANLMAPLRIRDLVLADDEAFDMLVEMVSRLFLSVFLFDSDLTREDDDLRRFLVHWLEPHFRGDGPGEELTAKT